MRIYLRLFFLLVLFLAGCAPHQKHIRKDKTTAFIHPLPAVFRADLALKRCPPTSFELVLRPDGLYFLQMEKSTPSNTSVQAETGVWRYNEEKKIVQLTSYDKAVRILEVTGKQTLKLTKASGGRMPFLVRYDFTLTHTEPNYKGVVRVQGMYSRKRGRGIFRECLSGVSFPLLTHNRAAEAEQAYQDILHGRAGSLFVTLDVRFSSRSGRGDRLIPVRSVSIDPYRSCNDKELRIATIADNRWYLIEVGGKTLEPESVSKPPFLKVQSGEQLIQGSAGCNHFTGSWLFADNEFVFSRIAATRMACPVGMEVEDAFLQALDNTRRYTIRGDILSLRDRRGKVLARLRYSRQLTDLDYSYLSPDQKETGEGIPADEGVPESHRVEAEGAVPASVRLPLPVEAGKEKIQPKSSKSKKKHTGRHKITVLKAKRKVAVRATAPANIRPRAAKKAAPAPKTAVPTAVNKRQKRKVEVPSVPEKREKVEKRTEQKAEKKAPVDNSGQATTQQSNQGEEVSPPKEPVATTENKVQAKPGPELTGKREESAVPAPEAGEKIPEGEAIAQPAIQSREQKESTTENKEQAEPEPNLTGTREESAVTASEDGEKIPEGEAVVQPAIQSSQQEEVAPFLPPEAENEEQAIQPPPLAVEEEDTVLLPEAENKMPAKEMVQPDPPSDVVEKINPSTTPSPERENNDLSLPSEDLGN